jgi:hypothetical protein
MHEPRVADKNTPYWWGTVAVTWKRNNEPHEWAAQAARLES